MPCATPCSNCDRKGLPILFIRYAAGYSARDEGMTELKKLQPSGKLQASLGGVALQTAIWNMRMLRAGFLYTRIERQGLTPEWKAYAVHPHGYLAEFDPRLPQDAKAQPACEVETRGAIFSLVWVPDAKSVTSMHFMFHPDPLAWDHLKKKIEPGRDKYMQSFDVAGWANGNTSQSDTCQPGQLNSQVMEFSAIYSAAVQSVGSEQHYGLMGTHGAERDWGSYTEARHGRHFEAVRHEERGLDGSVTVTDTGATGGMASGPYVAEVKNVRYQERHGPRLKKIAEFLQQNKGAVVACEDSFGIAQELALHHLTAASDYIAWLKEVDASDTFNPKVTNGWKQATSESIKTMEGAIYKRAMQVYDDETERLRQVRDVMDQRHAYPVKKVLRPRPDGTFEEVEVKDLEAQRKKDLDTQIESRQSDRHIVSEVEAASALRKMQAHYDAGALQRFDTKHLDRIKDRDKRMNAMSEDLIAWLTANLFVDVVLGRYDRSPTGIDTGDGARCAGQLCAILEPMDSSPRGRRWYAELQLFKAEPKNIVWRMVTLNNEQISDELQRVMDEIHDTVPPATVVAGAEGSEESARQQQAWAAMAASLEKIPKTLKGSESILAEVGKVLDGKTSLLQKFKSLQKIADTAKKNVHTVWCIAVIEAAKKAPPSQLERFLARGQVLILAHGLGEKAIGYVKDEERRLAEAQRAAGNSPVYSNKRNPEPGSRAWERKYGYKGEKLQARTERAVSKLTDPKVQNLRLPSAFAAIEVMGLLPTFGRAAHRQDDPRAGSQAAGAVAAAMGTLKGWRASFYENNVLEEVKAKIPLHKQSANLGRATSEELQAMKVGAAHWVAAGAVVGVVWDAVDGGKARSKENWTLMIAYYGRTAAGVGTIGTGLTAAYYSKNVTVVLWCTRINIVAGVLIAVASYAIEKLKEKEWAEWLQAEPFRKSDSKVTPHRTEALMLSSLGNAIADME